MYLMFLFCIVLLYNSVKADNISSRIFDGLDASIEDFPFIISLRRNNSHSCGGSILTNNWMMTAGHCFKKLTAGVDILSVQVGRTEISKSVDSSVYAVDRFVVHPEYSQSKVNNDIALIKLKSPLTFSKLVQPVTLPPVCYEVKNPKQEVTVIGWGVTNEGHLSKTLQQLNYHIVPHRKCNRQYKNRILSTQICTASPGPFKGDSGGPLMHQGLQVGIVSWGRDPLPGVFTKVSHFIRFIYMYTDLALDKVRFLPCSSKTRVNR
ncbi:chymotrypsin-1-like [Sabethes cyaneus]|uniref:chymotrypsin-1-like n=1 Tax=Sabethes cyaneus TaxID=53552 RepID=UPI00237EB059|nr:chymotrypsin-1-like [Sabethes cyaneus]